MRNGGTQRSMRRTARQRGSVTLFVLGLLALLIAAAGLAVDAGQLFVTKSELQTAADACALAAAQRLNCIASDSTCLTAAETAGIAAGALNKAGLQSSSVALAAGNLTFSTALNGAYATRTGGAANASRFARCAAASAASTPWILGLIGIAASTVNASATATLSPSSVYSTYVPIGICSTALSPTPAVGTWINLDTNGTTNMRFIAGSTAAVNDILSGESLVAGVSTGTTLNGQTNNLNSVGNAFNTRFGIYGGTYASAAAYPPDNTGYGYPNQSPGSPVIASSNAFSNYIARAKSAASSDRPFIKAQFNLATGGLPNATTASDHLAYGKPRRLVQAAVLNCGGSGASVTVQGMVCLLLLNPLSNGSSSVLKVEYLGSSSSAGSPCPPAIGVPTPSGGGPLVPALVQ